MTLHTFPDVEQEDRAIIDAVAYNAWPHNATVVTARKGRPCSMADDASWFRACHSIQPREQYVRVRVFWPGSRAPLTAAVCDACAEGCPTLPRIPAQSHERRFRKFVPEAGPDECWEWQSTRNRRGYGKFWLNGRTDLAHRVSYELAKGPIPAGALIRHTCDNPPCVNPRHLLTGDAKDNARDAMERDRVTRGMRNGRAKLTTQQVIEIKEAWRAGETQVSLARRFSVSRSAIGWIVNGTNWAGVGEAS